MNRQAEHRATHRALIESCEPRQGEFSDSPHLGARTRRQKTSVSAAAAPRLTSRRCQVSVRAAWRWAGRRSPENSNHRLTQDAIVSTGGCSYVDEVSSSSSSPSLPVRKKS
ncbi:hypothetical protein EYF80_040474 [Liparis tanakae]|uniref:Uncharacterized protein n=1 Tax=Liparis tanakae TaxID=230148 RepID=A0A4Z2G702_9TELE|nr:hypothetical protein EYF80_040474 [Liparis tanakae]